MFGTFLVGKKLFGKPVLMVGVSYYLIFWGTATLIQSIAEDYFTWKQTFQDSPLTENFFWYIENFGPNIIAYFILSLLIIAGISLLRLKKSAFLFLLIYTIAGLLQLCAVLALFFVAPEEPNLNALKPLIPGHIVSFLFLILILSYTRSLTKSGLLK